jgi:hypothetical protein
LWTAGNALAQAVYDRSSPASGLFNRNKDREYPGDSEPGKRLARFILVANRRTQDALLAGINGQIIEVAENGVDFNI